jgi:hypothetical protein
MHHELPRVIGVCEVAEVERCRGIITPCCGRRRRRRRRRRVTLQERFGRSRAQRGDVLDWDYWERGKLPPPPRPPTAPPETTATAACTECGGAGAGAPAMAAMAMAMRPLPPSYAALVREAYDGIEVLQHARARGGRFGSAVRWLSVDPHARCVRLSRGRPAYAGQAAGWLGGRLLGRARTLRLQRLRRLHLGPSGPLFGGAHCVNHRDAIGVSAAQRSQGERGCEVTPRRLHCTWSVAGGVTPALAEPWQLLTLTVGSGGVGQRAGSLGFSCPSHRAALVLFLALRHVEHGGGAGGVQLDPGADATGCWGAALWSVVRLRLRYNALREGRQPAQLVARALRERARARRREEGEEAGGAEAEAEAELEEEQARGEQRAASEPAQPDDDHVEDSSFSAATATMASEPGLGDLRQLLSGLWRWRSDLALAFVRPPRAPPYELATLGPARCVARGAAAAATEGGGGGGGLASRRECERVDFVLSGGSLGALHCSLWQVRCERQRLPACLPAFPSPPTHTHRLRTLRRRHHRRVSRRTSNPMHAAAGGGQQPSRRRRRRRRSATSRFLLAVRGVPARERRLPARGAGDLRCGAGRAGPLLALHLRLRRLRCLRGRHHLAGAVGGRGRVRDA